MKNMQRSMGRSWNNIMLKKKANLRGDTCTTEIIDFRGQKS